jgi:PAS domain S-box-containing protein
VLDRDWQFVKINRVAEQILNVRRENLLGRKLWDIFPDTPKYNYPINFRKAMYEYLTVTFEDYRADLNLWFRAICYPSPTGLSIFFRDISQEKKSQAKLKNSENKLRAILDSTTDSNILIDPDYKILSFNKTATEVSQMVLGKPLAEMADIWEYVLPNDQNDFYADTQKALRGETFSFERELVFAQFSLWYQVSYFPVYDSESNISGFTFNTTNIDKRKRAELKLMQSETMLRALYDSTSEAITFIDKDLRLVFSNKFAQEITKSIFGKESQIGDNCLDYIVPELQAEFTDHYNRTLQGETIYVEKEHLGTWWRFSLFPVYDSENNIVGIADNVKDITQRKASELKILQQNDALREIAWQQSHEVRRPVANILGLIGLMEEEPGQELFHLKYLKEATEELDSIIHKIVAQTNKI